MYHPHKVSPMNECPSRCLWLKALWTSIMHQPSDHVYLMHQRVFSHTTAWAHAISGCPWHWACVRLYLIARLTSALLMPCTTNPIGLSDVLVKPFKSQHRAMALRPWPNFPHIQGTAPLFMHRHVEFELIAYLVTPSSHDTIPMASWTSSMHKFLGTLVPMQGGDRSH